jgi:GT2 family glycosyltransferase
MLPSLLPLVSLIIPTHNGLPHLKDCIESILTKTDYSNFEIVLVDNGSDDPEVLKYMESLGSDKRIRVFHDSRPFNYSALNNEAIKIANGEILGLVNDDVEALTPGWLSEMVSLAMQPTVGAVGARLLYPDGSLQHGGIILGVRGVAGYSHKGISRHDHGYIGRVKVLQCVSAVTGACLVIKKSIFNRVNGLDENLAEFFNDLDFCLKVRDLGFRNVWTPFAELIHHESKTYRAEDAAAKANRRECEIHYIQRRWGDALLKDPAYNPNLTLDDEDFSLSCPPRREIL